MCAWNFLQFSPAQLVNPDISGPAANPDNYSTSNLGEFFAGSDPLTFDLGPVAELVESNGQYHLQIRRNPAASALAVQIEESGTLSGWQALNPQPAMAAEILDGWDYLSFPMPASGDDRRFWPRGSASLFGVVYDNYVDAVLGSNSNNGTSPTTAFQSLSVAQAAVLAKGAGTSLRLRIWMRGEVGTSCANFT